MATTFAAIQSLNMSLSYKNGRLFRAVISKKIKGDFKKAKTAKVVKLDWMVVMESSDQNAGRAIGKKFNSS